MNETHEAILAEWRSGGLERCIQGTDYYPHSTFDQHGRLKRWRRYVANGLTMKEVESAVSQATGVRVEMLHTNRQAKENTRPRQLAMFLMRDFCPVRSLTQIGRFFDRDHTTVMHAIRRSEALLEKDPDFFAAHERARHILIGMSA